jgi:hypothetical protein
LASEEEQVVAAQRILLHIGTMKSGTSYVQSALMGNHDALSDAGFTYVGGTFARQSRAVRDVLRRPKAPTRHRSWLALAREARDTSDLTGVISMEFLSFAEGLALDAVLKPLAGLQVDVVLTVRDQLSAIPAQWQTHTRNLGTEPWRSYLRRITGRGAGSRRSRAHHTFHRAQDVPEIVLRWSSHELVNRLDLVAVPPPTADRAELWRRFCDVAGIPVATTTVTQLYGNPSLGYASCDFLRRLNVHLDDVRPREYRHVIRPLARDVLVALRDSETRPRLDAKAARFAYKRNQATRDLVGRHGLNLVGDPDDLPVAMEGAAFDRVVSDPPAEQVVRAGVRAWDYALERSGLSARSRPSDLEDIVVDCADMLRPARGRRR